MRAAIVFCAMCERFCIVAICGDFPLTSYSLTAARCVGLRLTLHLKLRYPLNFLRLPGLYLQRRRQNALSTVAQSCAEVRARRVVVLACDLSVWQSRSAGLAVLASVRDIVVRQNVALPIGQFFAVGQFSAKLLSAISACRLRSSSGSGGCAVGAERELSLSRSS